MYEDDGNFGASVCDLHTHYTLVKRHWRMGGVSVWAFIHTDLFFFRVVSHDDRDLEHPSLERHVRARQKTETETLPVAFGGHTSRTKVNSPSFRECVGFYILPITCMLFY